jgi:hypothetical protein
MVLNVSSLSVAREKSSTRTDSVNNAHPITLCSTWLQSSMIWDALMNLITRLVKESATIQMNAVVIECVLLKDIVRVTKEAFAIMQCLKSMK